MVSQNTKINLSYVGALIICTVSGTSYLFGAYSTELADKLKFNSVEINTIGSAANYGFYLSSPFFGHIADNYGSNRTCLVSSFVIFFSYLCVALTYNGFLPSPSFLICAVYLFFMGIASAAGLLCSLTTITRNLEIRSARRGIALSAPLGLYGLSSFIFSRINVWLFGGNVYHFLVFLAIVTGLGQFIGSWFLDVVLPPPSVQREEIVAAARATLEQAANSSSNERTSLLPEAVAHDEENDISGWELVQNDDARLLFFTLFFISGTGLMYINNVGTIIKTLLHNNHPHHELQNFQNLHVSLFSIFSCFARLSVGFFSDVTKNIFNIERLWFIAMSGLMLFVGQMIAGFGVKSLDVLWMASVFIGLGCGTMFGIAPTITSEWFGATRFGSNWGFMSYAPAFGGQLFSLIFGINYDYYHDKCLGVSCYNTAFIFSIAGSALSVIICLSLLWRRAKKDKRKWLKCVREREERESNDEGSRKSIPSSPSNKRLLEIV